MELSVLPGATKRHKRQKQNALAKFSLPEVFVPLCLFVDHFVLFCGSNVLRFSGPLLYSKLKR
jgi:hypothetical protein